MDHTAFNHVVVLAIPNSFVIFVVSVFTGFAGFVIFAAFAAPDLGTEDSEHDNKGGPHRRDFWTDVQRLG